MAKRRRISSLKRKTSYRPPKRKFILFCEGAKTERDYFEALGAEYCGAIVRIDFIGGVGVPKTVADHAIKELKDRGLHVKSRTRSVLNSFEEGDEVWAVFDRDEHPEYEESITRCKVEKVRVAHSNPCFELWLILHYQDYSKDCNHKTVQKDLGGICKEYSRKNKTVDCSKIVPEIIAAEKRAAVQLKNRNEEGNSFGPPSTTVGRLTARIRAASKKFEN